jgi:hypothetical protein
VSSCDPAGHFGVPSMTFMLPPTGDSLVYPDVQAAFPDVDWANLDRLYLPAGQYKQLQLGNLPVRTAEHPLVITNKGGQVVVGFNPTGNYIWSMGGGSNWILTGRYDADSQTGDAAFPGHACGMYAGAKYGIVSDDDFALSAPYLHMGLAVGGATDFEIEYVEVTRSGFAGIRLINEASDGLDKPMANVRVHDVYVHDTAGEGFYFGWTGTPPSNKFPGLQIYNSRILRTGNEALQVQDLGDGTHIHHNTFISGGLHWLDNGLGRYQDNLSQISTREGTIEIDHNVFIDGANTLVSFFSAPQTGDGDRHVTFHDNYFSDSIDLGMYLNGMSAAPSEIRFEHNVFRGLDFAYAPIDSNDPDTVAGRNGAVAGPVVFDNNSYAGATTLIAPAANVTSTNNRNEDAGAIELLDGPWQTPGHHLTYWAPKATVLGDDPEVTYKVDDVVVYGDPWTLYRAASDATGMDPPGGAWVTLPPPSDDVRVKPGTTYADLGVR